MVKGIKYPSPFYNLHKHRINNTGKSNLSIYSRLYSCRKYLSLVDTVQKYKASNLNSQDMNMSIFTYFLLLEYIN